VRDALSAYQLGSRGQLKSTSDARLASRARGFEARRAPPRPLFSTREEKRTNNEREGEGHTQSPTFGSPRRLSRYAPDRAMSGKDDFDDEGMLLLPKHTKVRLPRPACARGASPRSTRGRRPLWKSHGPRPSPRRLARNSFRSRGFFRASRAGDAMRTRAHHRARGRAAMRRRCLQHARIRRPTRASRERRRRPRAPRPPGSLAAHSRREKKSSRRCQKTIGEIRRTPSEKYGISRSSTRTRRTVFVF